MSKPIAPGHDLFTADDLAPSDHELRDRRKGRLDKAVTCIAVLCCGAWSGGLTALGVCAAPMVFRLTPYPHSGDAMTATFARFDTIAVGLSVVLLACEVTRTLLRWRQAQGLLARIRRYLAIIAALAGGFLATQLTPQLQALHARGVRRGVGADGQLFDQLHAQSELIGKAIVVMTIVLIFLHIFTLNEDDGDEHVALAPGAPGPAGR